MTQPAAPLLIEPEELEHHLGKEDVVVVDLSEPGSFARHHVPGAVHLDYRRIVAARMPTLGMLPEESEFGAALSSIGITSSTHVIAYDDEGSGRACRLLWTLDVAGHARASLLNGGMQAWINEGHRTEKGHHPLPQRSYQVTWHPGPVADKGYVLAHLVDPRTVMVDTRSPAEFSGENRHAARGGHIPGAVNIDWVNAIDRTRNLRLKPEDELRALFEGRGVTPDKEVITYCQTHHRSAHTYFVLMTLGYPQVKGYPGSWSEWGNDPQLPVET